MPESKYNRQKKYIKENMRRYALNLNRNTDVDILEYLEGRDNVQGYLKRLIREDMARQKAGEESPAERQHDERKP